MYFTLRSYLNIDLKNLMGSTVIYWWQWMQLHLTAQVCWGVACLRIFTIIVLGYKTQWVIVASLLVNYGVLFSFCWSLLWTFLIKITAMLPPSYRVCVCELSDSTLTGIISSTMDKRRPVKALGDWEKPNFTCGDAGTETLIIIRGGYGARTAINGTSEWWVNLSSIMVALRSF